MVNVLCFKLRQPLLILITKPNEGYFFVFSWLVIATKIAIMMTPLVVKVKSLIVIVAVDGLHGRWTTTVSSLFGFFKRMGHEGSPKEIIHLSSQLHSSRAHRRISFLLEFNLNIHRAPLLMPSTKTLYTSTHYTHLNMAESKTETFKVTNRS